LIVRRHQATSLAKKFEFDRLVAAAALYPKMTSPAPRPVAN
jgi:hypothetical protein